ncbi:MAG: FAD:protein FMN transferase [Paracoccaceae bacterium]|nr:FAD:protein FMN transferase [Paracoccaceae bacterium]
MPRPPDRRRFLAIAAAAIAAPGTLRAGTAAWRGTALGAAASITLGGTGAAAADETFAAVAAELERLEQVFSLYRPESALSRLNRDGRLGAPPGDLVNLLALSDALHAATGGAFDPTVQPLWLALARGGATDARPTPEAASDLVGWSGVAFDAAGIALSRPGMALTLNGVAQGHIADRIAALLGALGYRDVLVDMGEIAARGSRHGTAWSADVAAPDGQVLRRLNLRDRALAVSAPLGTLIDRERTIGHILDPRAGAVAPERLLVAVSAASAAVADGLSTGCCLLSEAGAARAVAEFPGARLESLI